MDYEITLTIQRLRIAYAESMEKIIDSLQKARLLESFCGHDLRGDVGRCISFLGLILDQLPAESSGEFREMIELSLKSAQTALDELDTRLVESSLETRYVWVYSKTYPTDKNLVSQADAVIIRIDSLEAFTEARRKYRPDIVFIDGTSSSPEEWRAIIDASGSPLTKNILLLPTERLAEGNSLENVEVRALTQPLETSILVSWL